MKKLLALTVLASGVFNTAAQEPASSEPTESHAPAPAEAAAAPSVEGKLIIQNRSSFSPGTITRNPCWPIGWVPPPKTDSTVKHTPAVVEKVIEVKPEHLHVSTILIGTPSIAIVNNREVGVGSTLNVDVGGSQAALKVLRIGDGYVEFEHRGQVIRAVQPIR